MARVAPQRWLSLEQVEQVVEAARHEHQRLSGQREQVTQSIRAIGHAYHFVDLERGVRRNGKLIAGDIQHQIDTIRTIAQQEALSQACLERIEKAERVVPKMQATLEFVSAYVRRQVHQLDLHRHSLTPCMRISYHRLILSVWPRPRRGQRASRCVRLLSTSAPRSLHPKGRWGM